MFYLPNSTDFLHFVNAREMENGMLPLLWSLEATCLHAFRLFVTLITVRRILISKFVISERIRYVSIICVRFKYPERCAFRCTWIFFCCFCFEPQKHEQSCSVRATSRRPHPVWQCNTHALHRRSIMGRACEN